MFYFTIHHLHDLYVKEIHSLIEIVTKSAMYTGAPINIKT